LWVSGFYYCREFLKDDPDQVVIDESAANVFANAKAASIGWSGRPKRVTIYKATVENGGLGQTMTTKYGLGFKSAGPFDLAGED